MPVMIKVARVEEEARGSALLRWWGGRGAAPVFERDAVATLMFRATGSRDLTEMVSVGRDPAATEILTRTVVMLHDRRPPKLADGVSLVPLQQWFGDLLNSAAEDAVIRAAADVARALLSATRAEDERALHGDIHHGNVLDFEDRWAAIDPKGLLGHRAFDYANILCNPAAATAIANVDDRLDAISTIANIDPAVLARWAIAWCGLSLTWLHDANIRSWHSETNRTIAQHLLSVFPHS